MPPVPLRSGAMGDAAQGVLICYTTALMPDTTALVRDTTALVRDTTALMRGATTLLCYATATASTYCTRSLCI